MLRDVREPRPRIIPAYAGQTHISTSVTGRWTDHPRACGANATAVDNCVPGDGSSPRMRGKRPSRYDIRGCRRIIPAHAGQTAYRSQGPSRRSDHPRACGANRVRWRARGPRAGSSPRMRGKLGPPPPEPPENRIIPAHAGQTAFYNGLTISKPDHPRACGANSSVISMETTVSGSSPRMRGKLMRLTYEARRNRIIPAHAGQTCTGNRGPWCWTDHLFCFNVCSTGSAVFFRSVG